MSHLKFVSMDTRCASSATLRPIAPTPPWLVPFSVWRARYAYFVDCIQENLRTCLTSGPSPLTYDWSGMRRDLERYLYSTGHSRFRSFTLLSGPRPDRHPAWSFDGTVTYSS